MGPTLNESYNGVLAAWAAAGSPSPPECEDCGADLTGKDVIDAGRNWLCVPCARKDADECVPLDPCEDFHSDG